MNRIQRLRRDQSGMSLVFIGLGMLAFVSASMLAIDVGMLMTARSQAQNSADSAALAGATALLYDDFNNRTASGPAVTNAIRGGQRNDVMRGQVSVGPADVTFPVSPTTGQADRVRVEVRRTASRGNAVSTLIARYFGMAQTDIGAVATAEAAPANAMDCVKPFTIPDKWREVTSPPWDSLTSTYDAFNNKGQPLPNPDVYVPAYDSNGNPDPNYTGYNMYRDKGTPLMIRAGTGNNITPSFYFSLALGTQTGGAWYDANIAGCNHSFYHWGDLLVQEPGNMMGPTVQGIAALIAQDPGAYWDGVQGKVVSQAFGNHSPRVFPIPLYDPIYYDSGKRNGRTADLKTANWIGFFVDHVSGNDIYGIITPLAGRYDRNGPQPQPNPAMPRMIRLVQ